MSYPLRLDTFQLHWKGALDDQVILNEIMTSSQRGVYPITFQSSFIRANKATQVSPITLRESCTVDRARPESTYCPKRYDHCPYQLLCSVHQVCRFAIHTTEYGLCTNEFVVYTTTDSALSYNAGTLCCCRAFPARSVDSTVVLWF